MKRKSQRIAASLFLSGLSLILTRFARADAIVSNLAEAQNADSEIYYSSPDAQEFTTGNQTYQLTSIKLRLSVLSPNGPYTALAVLVNDNGGLPGTTVITSFTIGSSLAASFPSFNTYTFTPNSSVTLAANTNYWLVLEDSGPGVSGSGGFYWAGNNTTVSPFLKTAESNNGGSSWVAPDFTGNMGAFLMEVDGSSPNSAATDGPVPLWALGALGAGLAGIASRRLKQS